MRTGGTGDAGVGRRGGGANTRERGRSIHLITYFEGSMHFFVLSARNRIGQF